jgi:hypothetical protein
MESEYILLQAHKAPLNKQEYPFMQWAEDIKLVYLNSSTEM